MLTKQSWTVTNGWSSSIVVGLRFVLGCMRMWLDSSGSGRRRVAGPSVNLRGPENARNFFTEKLLAYEEYS